MYEINIFHSKFYSLFFFVNGEISAQVTDPMRFFPSSVGNVWEYDDVLGKVRKELYKDSVDGLGFRYLFHTYNEYFTPKPGYKIDTSNYTIYWLSLYGDPPLEWTYYKLNANQGDVWVVDRYIDELFDTTYQIAECRNIYQSFFYNRETIFMEVTFYQYQDDSTLNQNSWPDYTITLAYGIGEIMDFDEGGAGPQRILRGCIIDGDTVGIITSVEEETLLTAFELYQNYPNPFNPATRIEYEVSSLSHIKLNVYDILGREAAVLVNEEKYPGRYSVTFNASHLSSGVYFYKLTAGDKTIVKQMVLLK
jgi:hypothetical protein